VFFALLSFARLANVGPPDARKKPEKKPRFRNHTYRTNLEQTLDHWIAVLLAPLAVWVFLNGIDDLFMAIAGLCSRLQERFSAHPGHRIPTDAEIDAVPPRPMAVFVALWREHRVIQKMIDNNVTRLRYPHCDFFLGVYPNDAPTIAAVRQVVARYPNVHLSMSPHDGPTSKADNLNWIYQRMLLYEQERNVRFEMILTHDAEDLIDPDALRWINYFAQWYDMVQIPVLALPTPIREFAHGVYCDEFAEFQYKDMPGRQLLGGFIPSNGVGTGFSRHALEMIAEAHFNRIFEPDSLTEDYENGFRIRRLGLAQRFIPIHFRYGRPLATRGYFPRKFRSAVVQRTRWIMGITLQSWEYHSARETFAYLYWFWRDRKGLAANLINPLTNVLFALGVYTLAAARGAHRPWFLARDMARFYPLYAAGLCMQAIQTAIRIACCARVYGWRFACFVPVRIVTANLINSFATVRAIWIYAYARIRRRPLRWVKTEHAYPNRTALMTERKSLGEVLTGSQWITPAQLAAAHAAMAPGQRLGEYLIQHNLITEDDLYTALSLQNRLPLGKPDRKDVSIPVTRALPLAVSRKWSVLPFRISGGELYLAGSELPGEELQNEIRRFSSLEVRFRLITPSDFQELARQYL
jgi:bacteriophage N4 adsorption protein B